MSEMPVRVVVRAERTAASVLRPVPRGQGAVRTLRQVGSIMGIGASVVREDERRAFGKIRDAMLALADDDAVVRMALGVMHEAYEPAGLLGIESDETTERRSEEDGRAA